MEDNFRNVLIILSGIVIGAIFIHGLWTIRKQKNPYKLKTSKDKIEPLARNFDGKGFDQDGVGQVSVKKAVSQQQNDEIQNSEALLSRQSITEDMLNESPLSDQFVDDSHVHNDVDYGVNTVSNQDSEVGLRNTHLNEQAIEASRKKENEVINEFHNNHTANVSGKVNNALDNTQTDDWHSDELPKKFSKDELGDDLTPGTVQNEHENRSELPESHIKEVIREPLYQQPVINAKPVIKPSRQSIKKSANNAQLKRNQMEINFGDDKALNEKAVHDKAMNIATDKNDNPDELVRKQNTEQERSTPQSVNTDTAQQLKLEPQVIILSVVMPANQQMFGAALLPSLLTLGMKYGEMNIFHRHQDNAGNGEVTFSLANMMKPGSFDLDTMETFATQGVSLFMTLPNAGDSFAVFEQMLSAAKQLAQEFNGQLLDDKRNVMTKQTEQHYTSKIREFDRRRRIALV